MFTWKGKYIGKEVSESESSVTDTESCEVGLVTVVCLVRRRQGKGFI